MTRKKRKKSKERTKERTLLGNQPHTELVGSGVLFTADHTERMTAVDVRDLTQPPSQIIEGCARATATESEEHGRTRKDTLLAMLAKDWEVFVPTDPEITQELIQNCTFDDLVSALRKGDAQRISSLQKERE